MANSEKIDEIIDEAAVTKQLNFISTGLDGLEEKIKTFPKLKDFLDAESWKTFVQANNNYSSSLVGVKKAQTEFTLSVKEHQKYLIKMQYCKPKSMPLPARKRSSKNN